MGDWSVLDYLIALLAGWVGLIITNNNKDIKY